MYSGRNLTQNTTIPLRNALGWVAAAMAIAIGLRAYLLRVMPVISRDGVTFIGYAQNLRTDPLTEIRRQRQAPLYPAMIALAHGLLDRVGVAHGDDVRRWVLAGQTVAVAASLALIPAMYLLAGVLFHRRVGVAAAACTAVLPEFCRYGVDVLSDSLHLALYVSGLAAGLAALTARPGLAAPRAGYATILSRFALAGLLSALAFLVRPEGGEVALVVCAALCLWRPWPWKARLTGIATCSLSFLVIAGPYMLATGHLIHKKPPARFLAAETLSPVQLADGVAPPVSMTPAAAAFTFSLSHFPASPASASAMPLWTIPRALGKTLLNWVRSLRVMFLLPAIAWLALRGRRPEPTDARRVAMAAWCLHAGVCVLLIRAFDYWDLFSVRHVLVLTALTLPWTAAGLVALVDLLTHVRPSPRATRHAAVAIGAVLVAPTLPWLLRAPNTDDAYMRRAGEWIAAHYPRPQRILTDQWHVPFYARGTLCERREGTATIRWPGTADPAVLVDWVRRERPDLVVLDEFRLRRRNPAFFDELPRAAARQDMFRLVYRTEGKIDPRRPRRALVYEVAP